jgi:hypothetical protein
VNISLSGTGDRLEAEYENDLYKIFA